MSILSIVQKGLDTYKGRIQNPFWQTWLPWIIATIIATIAKIKPIRHNNFSIFRHSWLHFSERLPLYVHYTRQYNDLYLYGPTFALLIAPIAALPPIISYLVWQCALGVLFAWAILKLPLTNNGKIFISLWCAKELVTALMMQQFNIAIGALIILTFVCIEREQELWATLCIALGLSTKIYGIVGLAFFPFAKHKLKFILYLGMWTIICFALPYLFSDTQYVTEQYHSWFTTLGTKNEANTFSLMQNISTLGILRKVSGSYGYSDLIPIGMALCLYASAFLRFKQYKLRSFRLAVLASTLMFVVLFSTGSESSSYIIAYPGIALWWISRPVSERSKLDWCLLIGVFLFSSLSRELFTPSFVQTYLLPYAHKAVFPTLIWLRLSWELTTHHYQDRPNTLIA